MYLSALSKDRLPWTPLATSQTFKRKDGLKLLLEQPRKVRVFFPLDFTSKFLVLKLSNLRCCLRSQTLDEARGCSDITVHPWHFWYPPVFSEPSSLNQSCSPHVDIQEGTSIWKAHSPNPEAKPTLWQYKDWVHTHSQGPNSFNSGWIFTSPCTSLTPKQNAQ